MDIGSMRQRIILQKHILHTDDCLNQDAVVCHRVEDKIKLHEDHLSYLDKKLLAPNDN